MKSKYLKYTFVVALTLLAYRVGCGTSQPKKSFGIFQQYVDSFKAAGKTQGVKIYTGGLQIEFVEGFKGPKGDKYDYSHVIGLCVPGDELNLSTIYILRPYWRDVDEMHKEQLIWHEMGHCVLGRPHLMQIKENHPISIMYPDTNVVNDEEWYAAHKKDFIEELFRSN